MHEDHRSVAERERERVRAMVDNKQRAPAAIFVATKIATLACRDCGSTDDDESMLLCDACDGAGRHRATTSRNQTRRLIVQAGAFGEHDFTRVRSVGDASDAELSVNGRLFSVELPPTSSIRIDASMKRFANNPSYAFPWHGNGIPIPFP